MARAGSFFHTLLNEQWKLNSTPGLAVAGMIAIILILRLLFLSSYSPVWIDEQVSINAACGDSSLNAYPAETLERKLHAYKNSGILAEKIFTGNVANDRGNALLFDYLLSGWFLLFGISFISIKSISMVLFFFVVLIILRIHNSKGPTLYFLLLLLLVHPLLYRYSLECRIMREK